MGHEILFGTLSFIVDDSHGFGMPLSTLRRSLVAELRTSVPVPAVFFFSNSRLWCRPTPPSRAATSGPTVRGSNIG